MTATIIDLPKDAKAQSLETFLAGVELRAYRTALLTTRKASDALDIVQDAMLQLVQHYSGKDASTWPLLFQRILHNKVMDWHRHQSRQRRWFWQPQTISLEDDEDNPLASMTGEAEQDPAELVARAQDIEIVLSSLEIMPIRQRQAFMLRAWEGLDVSTTASVMGCSEGSVKTHYFRALGFLRSALTSKSD